MCKVLYTSHIPQSFHIKKDSIVFPGSIVYKPFIDKRINHQGIRESLYYTWTGKKSGKLCWDKKVLGNLYSA